MSKTLYEVLGVPEDTEIEIGGDPIAYPNEIRVRLADTTFLSYSPSYEWAEEDTIELLLGNLYWRVKQAEYSPEVRKVLDAVRVIFPAVTAVVKTEVSRQPDKVRLELVCPNNSTYMLFIDGSNVRALEFNKKYQVTPENPWRRLKIVEDTEVTQEVSHA